MSSPRWYIDTSDPSASALLGDDAGGQSQGSVVLFNGDTLNREVVLLTKPRNARAGLQLLDVTGGTVNVRIGLPGEAAYVETGDIPESTPAAGSATLITTGSAVQNAVFDVALSEDSTGGSFQLTFGRPHSWYASLPANTATKANGTITCVADSGGSLQSTFFDLPGASSAIVRFWYNEGGAGTAPATPAGGSLQAITTVTPGDSNLTVAALTSAAIEAHADFTSTSTGGAVITWAAAAYGTKTTIANAGTSGHTIQTNSQGNNGQLDQKSFEIADENGTVAVWFDSSSAGATGYPASAAAAARQIRVVIAAADTTSTVATAAASAIDADSKYTATSTGGTVTIVMVASGDMGNGDGSAMGGGGFSLVTKDTGWQSTYLLPWGAKAADLNNAFDGDFTAQSSSLNQWRITAANKGAFSAPTLVESGLTNATYFPIPLNMSGAGLDAAFAAVSPETYISVYLEVEFTNAATEPQTVLQIPCTVKLDIQ